MFCFAEKMSRRQEKSSYVRIAYPSGCKELSEELSKEELLKRLKVDISMAVILSALNSYSRIDST